MYPRAEVRFKNGGKTYTYESHQPVWVGDRVIVQVGKSGMCREATVVKTNSTYRGKCKRIVARMWKEPSQELWKEARRERSELREARADGRMIEAVTG